MENQDVSENLRHPILNDFMLQYPNCDQVAAFRAFLVYQDLTEVEGWWFTELAYSEIFERPYVLGQATRYEQRQAVFPIGVDERLSLNEFQQFFSRIFVDEEPIDSFILAVNELDTTVVYYKMTAGLAPPDPPETVFEQRAEKNRKMNRKRLHIASCVRQARERLTKDGAS